MSRATWTCVQTSYAARPTTNVFLRREAAKGEEKRERKKERKKENKRKQEREKSAREEVFKPWNSQNTRVLTVVLCRWWLGSQALIILSLFTLGIFFFPSSITPSKYAHCSLPTFHICTSTIGKRRRWVKCVIFNSLLAIEHCCLLSRIFRSHLQQASVYLSVCWYKFTPTKVYGLNSTNVYF